MFTVKFQTANSFEMFSSSNCTPQLLGIRALLLMNLIAIAKKEFAAPSILTSITHASAFFQSQPFINRPSIARVDAFMPSDPMPTRPAQHHGHYGIPMPASSIPRYIARFDQLPLFQKSRLSCLLRLLAPLLSYSYGHRR